MSLETEIFEGLKEALKNSNDGKVIAATEKFLTEMKRVRKMELRAIEDFSNALRSKKNNFKQPAR